MAPDINMTERRFLRFPEVARIVALSRTEIYRRIQGKRFPAPIPLGANSVAWDSTEVDQWVRDRIQEAKEARQ